MRLAGKKALVTAAGQGIGKATAERFAAEGAAVVASDINSAALKAVAGCETHSLDVTDQGAVQSLAAELGAIDVLFNCAGFVHHGTVLECSEADWETAFDLNVRSMFHTTKAFLPAMLEGGGGAIINVASVASSLKGVASRCAYGASKAAVIGLTKSVAADFVTRGIRCNAIAPGTVQSPSLEDRLAATGDYESARKAFIARQPMGRLGTAEEIAAIATYLASDEATFTTGQCFVVDGGMVM